MVCITATRETVILLNPHRLVLLALLSYPTTTTGLGKTNFKAMVPVCNGIMELIMELHFPVNSRVTEKGLGICLILKLHIPAVDKLEYLTLLHQNTVQIIRIGGGVDLYILQVSLIWKDFICERSLTDRMILAIIILVGDSVMYQVLMIVIIMSKIAHIVNQIVHPLAVDIQIIRTLHMITIICLIVDIRNKVILVLAVDMLVHRVLHLRAMTSLVVPGRVIIVESTLALTMVMITS